jgi:lipopolysaccharide transport system ATP-binding protein
MSSDVAIQVSHLSKAFPVYEKPIHRLAQMLSPRSQKNRWFRKFEALRNIDFNVHRGETLGIVGRNGSGKSTLLQIICGTLAPSSGDVSVNGRVAALLELGAGFNPEFTGRENVFLNGTVLGLSRQEITERFDEIAAFADIGDFMDQPVKSYSSGMYVRLAFAVAINVTPDVLIIDEALSVGDEAFQRKCFSRINRIRDGGATVLFVSHSAGTITQLCDRALLLDKGEQISLGTPKFVVSRYHKLIYAPPERMATIREQLKSEVENATSEPARNVRHESEVDFKAIQRDDSAVVGLKHAGALILGDFDAVSYNPGMVPVSTVRYSERGAEIMDPHLETVDGRRVNILAAGHEYVYTYQVRFDAAAELPRFGMLVKTVTGIELGGGVSSMEEHAPTLVEAGATILVRFRFRCLLDTGVYFLNAGVLARVGEEEVYLDRIIDAAMFRVVPTTGRLATGYIDFDVLPSIGEVMPHGLSK